MIMHRIFHARVPLHTIIFLFLLTVVCFWSFWTKTLVPALVTLLMLVVLVERIIHTTYTVTTDGRLIVSRGRFSSVLVLPLSDIRRIEKMRSANIGRFHLSEYLIIYYTGEGGAERSVTLQPTKEEELVAYIKKVRDGR